ncbi:hypothetical protein DOK_18595 [gamma proteobacterium BDW918]|uniref:Lipocalin-like domain-containing protein n=2 Tax=Zhongshania aliphaticivorans TaxID=1470434 RepID=A0A127M0V1_9GAMM|nr:hypothetical protein AZF00_00375 [Zhongshania aliphaticivorans]EIF41515.1 hypothetical protein DOK_18595 [gamma proteobacterium BDW918]|tara:strand:+ start:27925 stop:28581 length:657 start_codon:yes stop_codon:yes gene_type:complete
MGPSFDWLFSGCIARIWEWFYMKQALYFGVLSVLLAGCSQFKTNKQTAPIPINLESHVQALDENAQAEDVPTPTPKIITSNSRTMLLGKWYGIRKTNNGGQKEWLTERSADGTYRVDFRFTAKNGDVRTQSEVGFWGVSGGTYFRIFRGWITIEGMKPADPTKADHYDAYAIQSLNDTYFSYKHVNREHVYTVKKMPADFRLPLNVKSESDEPLTFSF